MSIVYYGMYARRQRNKTENLTITQANPRVMCTMTRIFRRGLTTRVIYKNYVEVQKGIKMASKKTFTLFLVSLPIQILYTE